MQTTMIRMMLQLTIATKMQTLSPPILKMSTRLAAASIVTASVVTFSQSKRSYLSPIHPHPYLHPL
jgi:hypothetical protein